MRARLCGISASSGAAQLLVKRALAGAAGRGFGRRIAGPRRTCWSTCAAWCPAEGHEFACAPTLVPRMRRPRARRHRSAGTVPNERAVPIRSTRAVVERPPQRWGLAARGALVEAGSPRSHFALADKDEVWAADAARLYAQAAAAQWDPATAIPWDAEFDLPDEVEDAVVQIMTYLVENETAALIVPSRFIAQLHPHFREVMQLLASAGRR